MPKYTKYEIVLLANQHVYNLAELGKSSESYTLLKILTLQNSCVLALKKSQILFEFFSPSNEKVSAQTLPIYKFHIRSTSWIQRSPG